MDRIKEKELQPRLLKSVQISGMPEILIPSIPEVWTSGNLEFRKSGIPGLGMKEFRMIHPSDSGFHSKVRMIGHFRS